VVAEKQVVYDKFPIPLINRLEKHFLTLNNIMTTAQLEMALRLRKWAEEEFITDVLEGPMTRARARRSVVSLSKISDNFHTCYSVPT
jgi:hypothetical protein